VFQPELVVRESTRPRDTDVHCNTDVHSNTDGHSASNTDDV
jgi:hypothetical protein